jgi:hypothetical protein
VAIPYASFMANKKRYDGPWKHLPEEEEKP